MANEERETIPDQPEMAGDVAATAAAQEAPEKEEPDWRDLYMRTAAEFDNYRKRQKREQDETVRLAKERIMVEWLDIVDSVHRALDAVPDDETGPMVDGLETIRRQSNHILTRLGLQRVTPDGGKFDPNLHDALSTMPNAEAEDGTILYTERSGYQFKDGRVLRPARVVVARNS